MAEDDYVWVNTELWGNSDPLAGVVKELSGLRGGLSDKAWRFWVGGALPRVSWLEEPMSAAEVDSATELPGLAAALLKHGWLKVRRGGLWRSELYERYVRSSDDAPEGVE